MRSGARRPAACHLADAARSDAGEPLEHIPTTLARTAGALYAVNARFGKDRGPDVTYSIVRVG